MIPARHTACKWYGDHIEATQGYTLFMFRLHQRICIIHICTRRYEELYKKTNTLLGEKTI